MTGATVRKRARGKAGRRITAAAVGVAIAFTLSACGSSQPARPASPATTPAYPAAPTGPTTVNLLPIRFGDLPGWSSDKQIDALASLQKSCPKFTSRDPGEALSNSASFGRMAQWQQLCAASYLVRDDNRASRDFFENWFVPYEVIANGSDRGLFTGYYEPILHGSWVRTSQNTVPVYRPPSGATAASLKSGGALPSRAQIEAGALRGRGLELLWLDDPIDAFFLHIQGSGQVQMTDGSLVRIGYAGKNGHPYFPIGAELIRIGEVPKEQMSMQAIRSWLISHPQQAPALMNKNASYVFFRTITGDGPIGAQGVALSPKRSIAVDPAFVPYGVPVWLDTSNPLTGAPMQRLVVAQDTGGAIKGPVRGDLFWGAGPEAEAGAGLMKQEGRWFLLLPRAAAAVS